jgi:hypothetical protein
MRSADHVGQEKRICWTVIVPVSHGQRGLSTAGTRRRNRKELKLITPVLSCMRRALCSLRRPSWSLRIARVTVGVNLAVFRPLSPVSNTVSST